MVNCKPWNYSLHPFTFLKHWKVPETSFAVECRLTEAGAEFSIDASTSRFFCRIVAPNSFLENSQDSLWVYLRKLILDVLRGSLQKLLPQLFFWNISGWELAIIRMEHKWTPLDGLIRNHRETRFCSKVVLMPYPLFFI